MLSYKLNIDKKSEIDPHLNILKRLDTLIDQYLTPQILCTRLEDLPIQFKNPQPRPWQPIHWQNINPEQVIGIELEVFLSILIGAIETEEPIRGYTQTSRQYLEPIHPQLARFVGGIAAPDGTMLELGLWEKEERQHAPALIKIYKQLTGKQPTFSLHTPKTYQPLDHPYDDLYRHGLHRVITEYSAVCLYLWLMAHTTSTLQQVFAELLQDEINHMTKFWGFGLWLFPESYLSRIKHSLHGIIIRQNATKASHIQSTTHLFRTFRRMMGVLNWNGWSWYHRLELVYTFIKVLHLLWRWSKNLTPEYLKQLFVTEY
ncbi:hypothetical protein C7H19_00500 [Aphanothece hegewaldii CCALA 016]|uniref:Ferritin-like domain-containing protein n=1 Tax=Aphanothece hegewaldii CCALA 016 TaxID=2107694 RepID=A0A2T1M394_9CHRO|nr:ferritin-like domain-containing protein [Aphanothece hegewaldii]PSF39302.1 hypothetical protein C7H19_00500 [Aphanothece hegewaldii CCALA 016]